MSELINFSGNESAGQRGSNQPAGLKTDRIINSESLICGLYLGLIMTGLYLIAWLMDPMYSTSAFISGSLQILELALLCLFLLSVRKLAGNYITYWQAFRAAAFISLISVALKNAWYFILYHFIDRTLGGRIADVTFAIVQKELIKAGLSQGSIDANLESMREYSNPASFKLFMYSLGSSILGCIVISLILAAIVKKEKPVFVSV